MGLQVAKNCGSFVWPLECSTLMKAFTTLIFISAVAIDVGQEHISSTVVTPNSTKEGQLFLRV
jgi:hypothetical protein